MKNIVILGGGSAGWLTAITLKNYFPKKNVILIQSSDIGIIGVGEATTPNLVGLLNRLDINPFDVIRQTNGTFKHAIKFDNWNGDGKYYYHSFADKEKSIFSLMSTQNDIYLTDDQILEKMISENLDINNYYFANKLCEEKHVNLMDCNWAIHFDATLFARYLQKVGQERGIKLIEGEYTNAQQDENGFIRKLFLKDGISVDCDFVFDCSGFHRLLIGKLYNQKWTSYSKHLPMKKAIPFWLEPEKEINSYTDSIAMKNGWIWKIPLQNRIGSGYIFDSDYIDENQALEEAEQYYGRKLEIRKIIPFEAGRYDKLWIKNCIAIGLSATFVEPIESTSLFLTVIQLIELYNYLDKIEFADEIYSDVCNKNFLGQMERILDFVYLHYVTKRNDSEFWKNLKYNYAPTKTIEELLYVAKHTNVKGKLIKELLSYNVTFAPYSYLTVMYGLDILKTNYETGVFKDTNPTMDQIKLFFENHIKNNSVNHKNFIDYIKTSKFANEHDRNIIIEWEKRKGLA